MKWYSPHVNPVQGLSILPKTGNLMKKQHLALIALAVWMTLVSGGMILMQKVDLEVFFVFALIGFLVVMQFMELKFVKPEYLKSVRFLMAAGIVIFAMIVAHKIMDILVRY